MAKLFNKIRKNLVSEKPSVSRTSKYLKYAIGEIVLVVIGILIALSINNWAESKKEDKVLKNIYSVIVKDLKNDINDIDEILKNYEDKKPVFNKVLDGKMTKEDYLKCPECLRLITGYPDLSLDVRGYNLLNNHKNISENNKDSLTANIVQFYTEQLYEININEEQKGEDFGNNYQYWKNNYSWFSDFATRRNTAGFIEYAVNSQDYKNRVGMQYLINYDVLLLQYADFKKNAENLIGRIETKNTN
ncbi:MAG: hypothetical protein COB12_01945 [Flavobacterium sp.]|nr:MAG: hypothetical protein COB12_01945 [Flavobacterium sp.]